VGFACAGQSSNFLQERPSIPHRIVTGFDLVQDAEFMALREFKRDRVLGYHRPVRWDSFALFIHYG